MLAGDGNVLRMIGLCPLPAVASDDITSEPCAFAFMRDACWCRDDIGQQDGKCWLFKV
jgi:hypothetical protein